MEEAEVVEGIAKPGFAPTQDQTIKKIWKNWRTETAHSHFATVV